MPTARIASLLLTLALIAAACGGDDATIDYLDPPADCRSAFAEGSVPCGPGTDITRLIIDPTGPIVLTIELAEPPHFDDDFRWLAEFEVSDLACGITNGISTGEGFVGSDVIGPYGYRVLTNENAPAGTCDGSLDGAKATIIFNIQAPRGPWSVIGGTQYVEIQNLDDDGSADDVAIDVANE